MNQSEDSSSGEPFRSATSALSHAQAVPRDPAFDGAIGMMREGYDFIRKRCERFGSDMFVTRILGRRATCVLGRDAARMFYGEARLLRGGALPRRVIGSLFGKGAVHTLDGEAHRHRKAAFLSLMTADSIELLVQIAADRWRAAIRQWPERNGVVVFDEAVRVLAAAACAWAGIPIESGELPRRARDLSRMVDSFGGVGPRLWGGKIARMRTERWMSGIVRRARAGRLIMPEGAPLRVMALHRDVAGQLLPVHTAAVELINVIRPIVAVSWYVAFAALALHRHPLARARLATGWDDAGHPYIDCFMQEVRRYYPFTPYLGAVVRDRFEWKGHAFEPRTLVLLDVYGTLHDPRVWDAPEEFRPERFERRRGSAFDLIPQGGNGWRSGHRCPGEWITMHLTTLALHFLSRGVTYEVEPVQDLRFPLSRMPTRPRSGVVIRNVRPLDALDHAVPSLPSAAAIREARTEVARRAAQ